jgi:flagellin
LSTAIQAEYAAGRTATNAGASATNTLAVTTDRAGSGNLAFTNVSGTVGGMGPITAAAGSGTLAAAVGAGVTNHGTLTLNSGVGFSVTGDTEGGLSTSSATLNTISSIDISTINGANSAISLVDGALSQVNSMRANLGAVQNRFASTISNLQTSAENITAARSRIQDTDFAAETASMTRGQILQQAGTAMLAQANSLPNGVLSLLRG